MIFSNFENVLDSCAFSQARTTCAPVLLLVVEPVEEPLFYILEDGEEKMQKCPEVHSVQGLLEAVAKITKEGTTPEHILDQVCVPHCLFPLFSYSLVDKAPILVEQLPAGHSICCTSCTSLVCSCTSTLW